MAVGHLVNLFMTGDFTMPVQIKDLDGKVLYTNPNVDSLRKLDLRGKSLPRADFRGLDITEMVLSNADIHGSDFSKATCRRVEFSMADARSSVFEDTDLYGSRWVATKLGDSVFRRAIIKGNWFYKADFGPQAVTWEDLRQIEDVTFLCSDVPWFVGKFPADYKVALTIR